MGGARPVPSTFTISDGCAVSPGGFDGFIEGERHGQQYFA